MIAGVAGDDADGWLQRVIDAVPASFEAACERWRGLYRAALEQVRRQSRIVRDASRSPKDRDQARLLRKKAENQQRILLDTDGAQHSDFNVYRYLAGEGFLPGYNFPRLPLAAFIPGRRRAAGQDEFLSRPRFLAISEFGPRSILYHEGSRYGPAADALVRALEAAGEQALAARPDEDGLTERIVRGLEKMP